MQDLRHTTESRSTGEVRYYEPIGTYDDLDALALARKYDDDRRLAGDPPPNLIKP